VVALEHGALVANFARDQSARDVEAELAIVGESKLLAAEGDVSDAKALGDSIEPAAL
jgi:hypothetical protein